MSETIPPSLVLITIGSGPTYISIAALFTGGSVAGRGGGVGARRRGVVPPAARRYRGAASAPAVA